MEKAAAVLAPIIVIIGVYIGLRIVEDHRPDTPPFTA